MSKTLDFLETHQSSTPSQWRENAQWRRDNEYWLKYSRLITLRVLRSMEEQSVTQVELSRRMGCSQQYVSSLLKGSSNMTLETISRLEKALDLDLIKSAFTYVRGYSPRISPHRGFLSDSEEEEIDPNLKTRELVEGYTGSQ